MCGILGVLRPTASHRANIGAALDSISHRGPDGEGHFAGDDILLGHRRLAVIDPHPRGRQPMVDDLSGAVITYNGEIYNYLELRDELRSAGDRFITDTDTEVLLRAYLRWGPDALARMNGMWAFAIWEPRHRRLFASRDRFGVKPFYLASVDGAFLFASEPKALTRLEPQLAEVRPAALRDLFADSRMHAGTATFFRDIEALAPGSWITVDAGTGTKRSGRYWDYPEPAPVRDRQSTPGEFAELFDDAVRLRLRSDVPVGLTLSGGLDSSAVLSAAHRTGASMRCFTSVYPGSGSGELPWARRAADLGGSSLEEVDAQADDWLETLQKVVWHMDSPGYSPAVFPLWQIMRRARAENIPVLLEGQGADELLAGYPQYVPMANADLLQRHGLAGLQRVIANLAGSRRTFGSRHTILWAARSLMPGLGAAWRRHRSGAALLNSQTRQLSSDIVVDTVQRDTLHARLLRDFSRDVLPALLHYGDSVSMAHGIESRLPFLDYRLVEWVFRNQPKLIEDGQTKRPVREFLRSTGFGVIAERPDKLGYPTPVNSWLTKLGQPIIRDRIAAPSSAIWEWFDAAATERMLARAMGGDEGAVFHLYKFLTVDIWLGQLAATRSRAQQQHGPAASATRPTRAAGAPN